MNLTFQNVAAGDVEQIKRYFAAVMPHITMVEELDLKKARKQQMPNDGGLYICPNNVLHIWKHVGMAGEDWLMVPYASPDGFIEPETSLPTFTTHAKLVADAHPAPSGRFIPYKHGAEIDEHSWEAAKNDLYIHL